jgi:hypothetical protein
VQKTLARLFTEHFGKAPATILPLEGDGSSRKMFRLIGDDYETVIGVIGPDAGGEPRVPRLLPRSPRGRPVGPGDLPGRRGGGDVPRGGSRRHDALRRAELGPQARRAATSRTASLPSTGAWSRSCRASRSRAEGGRLLRRLPARGVRSPVDPLGPELLQVPLPEAREHPLQRGRLERISSGSPASCSRRTGATSCTATSSRAT